MEYVTKMTGAIQTSLIDSFPFYLFQKLLKTSANPKSAKKKKKAAEKAASETVPQLVEQ